MSTDNKTLGKFILDGIPPAPRGVPQVEVTFDIDANGLLNVKAKDKATNKEQSIRIEGSSGLTDEEKKRMTADSERFAAEDAKKKEAVEARNAAEALIYSTEKALKDAGDKVSSDEKKPIEEKLEALKKVKDAGSVEEIKKASEELSLAAQKIGEALYKQQQSQQTAKPEESRKEGEENKEESKPEEK